MIKEERGSAGRTAAWSIPVIFLWPSCSMCGWKYKPQYCRNRIFQGRHDSRYSFYYGVRVRFWFILPILILKMNKSPTVSMWIFPWFPTDSWSQTFWPLPSDDVGFGAASTYWCLFFGCLLTLFDDYCIVIVSSGKSKRADHELRISGETAIQGRESKKHLGMYKCNTTQVESRL